MYGNLQINNVPNHQPGKVWKFKRQDIEPVMATDDSTWPRFRAAPR